MKLRQVTSTSIHGTFTLFIAMSDAEFDFFCRLSDLNVQAFKGRILHTVRGDKPSRDDIAAATNAFRHVHTKGPGHEFTDNEDDASVLFKS